MMVLPCLSLSTSPASRSTAKWADMVGLETGKCSASSPADLGPWRSSCSTLPASRVGEGLEHGAHI